MLTLFLLALALPFESSFFIGPLRLTPYRTLLIVLIVPCFVLLLSGRLGRVQPIDYLIGVHGSWVVVAIIIWGGLSSAWEPAGIYVIEALGSYLVARGFVRNYESIRRAYQIGFYIIVFTLPLAIFESVSGQHVMREAFQMLFGGATLEYDTARLGLYRALGPFEHPILFGVFSASFFGGIFYILGAGRVRLINLLRCGTVVLSVFFSLSTGPYIALVAQFAAMVWGRISRALPNRWWILVGLISLLYVTLDLLSNRTPFHVFVSYFTLNEESAYSRILMWEFGTAEVARHPVFGIGMGEWLRPTWMGRSMDNFWLLEAVRYGLPAVVLLAGSVLWLGWKLGRLKIRDPRLRNCRMAWMTTMVGFMVVGGTVHFWNAVFCLFFFFLGSGVWMLDAQQASRKAKSGRRGQEVGAVRGRDIYATAMLVKDPESTHKGV